MNLGIPALPRLAAFALFWRIVLQKERKTTISLHVRTSFSSISAEILLKRSHGSVLKYERSFALALITVNSLKLIKEIFFSK